MQIIFTSVFGEHVNYFSELCCFTSQRTVDKAETQLSTSNKDSFDRGLISRCDAQRLRKRPASSLKTEA